MTMAKAAWPIRRYRLGEEPANNDWLLDRSYVERLDALWDLIVAGTAMMKAGMAARGEAHDEVTTDESQLRRDVVRIVRRAG